MVAQRYLLASMLAAGLVSALLLGGLLALASGQPPTTAGWAVLLVATPALFLASSWLLWMRRLLQQARAHSHLLSLLAEGDLTARPGDDSEESRETRRLLISLRRALSQVQRVTRNVRRTCQGVSEQVRMLLEAARRQGAAVERSQQAVGSMGVSLQGAGKRVSQLETFAQESTGVLTQMSERLQQVAEALLALDDFSHRTTEAVRAMSERLHHIASSGDELARFANEAEAFVSLVQSGIDSVRRRASETNQMAQAVTSTAERGEVLVNDCVAGMYRVQETVHKAAELVDSLGVRSTEIGRIVDVIQDVADRTKLLALNAAITAAQAGEHGRPFGVVAEAIRGLAESTARSTREISSMVSGVRGSVETIVALVKEGRAQATVGVQLGDKAAVALKEIRTIIQRAFAAVEATVAETKRLEAQGSTVVEASRRVARQVDGVTRAAIEQASHGRELVQQTLEMTRLAQEASQKAEAQARTGRDLSNALARLGTAIEEIRAAHEVLMRGDSAIGGEVAAVREDAHVLVRVGDGLSRTVEQLGQEAASLESEVFRFQLPTPRAGGVLRVGLHQAGLLRLARGLDPLLSLDAQVVEMNACVFCNLVRLEDGVLVPDLAERWEEDGSARRFRFHLRRGVTFHDGALLTAHEVKRHFERLLEPSSRSQDRRLLDDVEGVHAFQQRTAREVGGLEVVDEMTLEVRLQAPKAFFLNLLALPSMAIARMDANGRLHGAGPYRLANFGSELITLERHGAYYRQGLPLVDRLEFHLLESRAAAVERLRQQELDLVTHLHRVNVEDLAGMEGHQLLSTTTPATAFLAFNLREPPFDDVRVRQALRAGLNLQGLVERFYPGARVARALTPPELLDDAGAVPLPRTDLGLAERLLREAGVRPVRLTIHHIAERDTSAEDAVLFGPLLEAGLVELRHVELNPREFDERRREGRLSSFRVWWFADYPDPDNFLHALLNSSAQAAYTLHYRNEEVDRLTAEARTTIDPEKRVQLYRRVEKQLHQDCPLLPLFHPRGYTVVGPRVQGLRLQNALPEIHFEELWLDPEA